MLLRERDAAIMTWESRDHRKKESVRKEESVSWGETRCCGAIPETKEIRRDSPVGSKWQKRRSLHSGHVRWYCQDLVRDLTYTPVANPKREAVARVLRFCIHYQTKQQQKKRRTGSESARVENKSLRKLRRWTLGSYGMIGDLLSWVVIGTNIRNKALLEKIHVEKCLTFFF